MTRRVIKPQPKVDGVTTFYKNALIGAILTACPYGQVGDRLWCKETWFPNHLDWRERHNISDVDYKADYDGRGSFYEDGDPSWRPSIFMPRWASRIDLEITDIRVERLQEIISGDCLAEGILASCDDGIGVQGMELDYKFSKLWDSLNAKRGYSWESNPFVWVIEFKRQISTEQTPERLEGIGYVPKSVDFNSSHLIHSHRAFFAQGGGSNVQDLICINPAHSKINKGGGSLEDFTDSGQLHGRLQVKRTFAKDSRNLRLPSEAS